MARGEFSRLRMLHLSQPRLDSIDLGASDVGLVGIDWADMGSALESHPNETGAFVQAVQAAGARLLVDQPPGAALPTLVSHRVDLIGGRA